MSNKKWNKLIKIINGNRFFKKQTKPKKFFKVVTWNKGNYHFRSDNEKFLPVKTAIEDQSGDIIVFTEAKFSPKDESDILGQFQDYEIHFKIIPGAINACIMMMVKKNTVNITRLENIEEPATSCMWFKIKTQDTNFVLATLYRQW